MTCVIVTIAAALVSFLAGFQFGAYGERMGWRDR